MTVRGEEEQHCTKDDTSCGNNPGSIVDEAEYNNYKNKATKDLSTEDSLLLAIFRSGAPLCLTFSVPSVRMKQ